MPLHLDDFFILSWPTTSLGSDDIASSGSFDCDFIDFLRLFIWKLKEKRISKLKI